MPKLIVSVLTSLDGYYEGPDKDLSSIPFEDAFNTHSLGCSVMDPSSTRDRERA
jgi:hypothetical protein